MLDIQILAKNSKHFGKNRYIKLCQKFANPENRRTFALGNGNKAVPQVAL